MIYSVCECECFETNYCCSWFRLSFEKWNPEFCFCHRSISGGVSSVWWCGKSQFPQAAWPDTLMADTDGCASVGQEALSVVSEEQPIFEPSAYTPAPAMHMKTEMTSPGAFSQASKPSPEPTEPEWVGSAPQSAGKRAEHVNGTRWVRPGPGHRGAQIPGLSDWSYNRNISIFWEFPHLENVYCCCQHVWMFSRGDWLLILLIY